MKVVYFIIKRFCQLFSVGIVLFSIFISKKMKKILIVDDDVDLRESLSAMLSADFDVTAVEGKDDAIEEIKQIEKPDIMLLDVKMRTKQEGFEFVEELSQMDYSIPIILVTSTDAMTVSRAIADIARKTREKYAVQDLSALVMQAVDGEILVDYYSEKSGENSSIRVEGFHPKPVKIEKLKTEINNILNKEK